MEGGPLLAPHQHQVLQVGDGQGAPVPQQEVEHLAPGQALRGVHLLGEDGEPLELRVLLGAVEGEELQGLPVQPARVVQDHQLLVDLVDILLLVAGAILHK